MYRSTLQVLDIQGCDYITDDGVANFAARQKALLGRRTPKLHTLILRGLDEVEGTCLPQVQF